MLDIHIHSLKSYLKGMTDRLIGYRNLRVGSRLYENPMIFRLIVTESRPMKKTT
jgi:hypothetical protein